MSSSEDALLFSFTQIHKAENMPCELQQNIS